MRRKSLSPSVFIGPSLLAGMLAFAGSVSCNRETPEQKFQRSMQQATEFTKAEKWDEARLALMNAITAKGDDANSHYQLAEVFMRLKKIGPAIDQYETSLNLNPHLRDPRLKLAAIKLGGSQVEAAESDIQKLLDDNAGDTEALLLKSAVAKVKGRIGEAQKILNTIIEKEPKNNLALAALADVTLAEGKLEQAEELFNQSLQIDPNNAAVRLAMADLYVKQNRLDEAQQILQNLIDKDPANSGLRFYLGEFLLARGSGEKATDQYRELLKSEPKRHDARDRLYDLLLLKREVDKAKALTTELIAAEPNQPGSLYFQGRDLELDGKVPEALALYLKAIEGLPGFSPLFRHAGILEIGLGKTSEGVEHLNQAVAINPADVGARITLARHYFLSRDFAQAKEHVNKVLKLFPRQIGANIIKADIALIEGDTATAEVIYKALSTTLPDNPIAFYKLAALAETKKDYPAAIDYFKKGLAFDKEVLMPAQQLARILAVTTGPEKAQATLIELRDASKGNKAEYNVILGSLMLTFSERDPAKLQAARQILTSALEEKPDLLPAYFSLAQVDALEGKPANAEENYKKILGKQPNHIPSRMLLAMSLEARKQFDEAIQNYRKILQLNPNFAAAGNNLAWLIVATGKGGTIDEALELALKAKEKLPNLSAVADTLGWIYHKKDAPRAALPILQEAVDMERKNAPTGPNGQRLINPEILYHLAVVQASMGLKEEAKKSAEECLALGGDKFPFAEEVKKLKGSL